MGRLPNWLRPSFCIKIAHRIFPWSTNSHSIQKRAFNDVDLKNKINDYINGLQQRCLRRFIKSAHSCIPTESKAIRHFSNAIVQRLQVNQRFFFILLAFGSRQTPIPCDSNETRNGMNLNHNSLILLTFTANCKMQKISQFCSSDL